MFALETIQLLNAVAYQLALEGKPESLALTLITDPRRKAELDALLARMEQRQADCCVGVAA